jgi:hypothetical protein
MTKLLEEAFEELRTLPEDEQDRAAQALLAFARERHEYSFDDEQIVGIHHGRRTAAGSPGTPSSRRISVARGRESSLSRVHRPIIQCT